MAVDVVRRRDGAFLISGFRIQAFVTRSNVVGTTRAGTASPRVQAIWGADGGEVSVQ